VALHLYGVVRGRARLPDGLTGRADASVMLVGDDDLALLVSEVDVDRPAGAKDLLAHARVLEAVVVDETVVPMQFGIAMPDEQAAREEVLLRERELMGSLLASFEGRVQLTVQGFLNEQPALREVLRREPALLEQREALRQARGPAAEAGQVELGRGVAEVLEYLEGEYHDILLERLAPLAEAVADNEVTGQHQVLNAAFLVPRDRRGAFDEEVAALAAELEEPLRIRYVGPQPPYSFVGPVRDGELAWG
jgi:hypothetical protein